MTNKRRVVFTFDERSLESLEEITKQGHYNSMAETVRLSLQVNRALQQQAGDGFTQLVVRNPQTGEERVIVIPHLQPLGKR